MIFDNGNDNRKGRRDLIKIPPLTRMCAGASIYMYRTSLASLCVHEHVSSSFGVHARARAGVCICTNGRYMHEHALTRVSDRIIT